jgi:transposase
MKKSRFTEQQIAYALRQAESGVPIEEITRKMGVTQATFYQWKKKYAGMGVAEQRLIHIRAKLHISSFFSSALPMIYLLI